MHQSDDGLSDFRKKGYLWPGGVKDLRKGAEIDSYVPSNTVMITKMLAPLEIVLRRTCYVSTKSRGLKLMATKLVSRGKPILVRYLKLIAKS
jgi:hypothetical protein